MPRGSCKVRAHIDGNHKQKALFTTAEIGLSRRLERNLVIHQHCLYLSSIVAHKKTARKHYFFVLNVHSYIYKAQHLCALCAHAIRQDIIACSNGA